MGMCRKGKGSKSKVVLSPRSKQEIFPCYNCNKKFTSGFMLKRHEDIHNGNFHCPEPGCESRFRNQTTLTKHQVSEHGLKLSRSQTRDSRLEKRTRRENN